MTSRIRDDFTFATRLRYFAWRASGSRNVFSGRSRSGQRLFFRPSPSTDLDTAYEVFVDGVYRSPREIDAGSVRRIVDLGANVGYSLMWWFRNFPGAVVTAFEPHPMHCEQIRKHLRANGLVNRVVLFEAAAGIADGTTTLSDDENRSTIVNASAGLLVRVRDVFAELDTTIDILKIDIEGAEYDILADPRFGQARPRIVVMEWHRTADSRSNPEWCEARLSVLGFETIRTADGESHGTIWGFAPPP